MNRIPPSPMVYHHFLSRSIKCHVASSPHHRCPKKKTLRRGAFHPSSTEDTETTCGSLSVVSILASSPTAMDRDVKGGSINLWGTSTNNNMKNS